MAKHFWISKSDEETIKVSPYTDIFINDTRIVLLRTDINTHTSIECSNKKVLDMLYKMLVDGYSSDDPSALLEDETIKMWLSGCIKKRVIE